jgi:chaperonin cofactor prefoldin
MENVENLVIEHLKQFQMGQTRIERKLDELSRRLSNLESGQASIIQHIGHLALVEAQQQAQADGFNERLERIEKRLELA